MCCDWEDDIKFTKVSEKLSGSKAMLAVLWLAKQLVQNSLKKLQEDDYLLTMPWRCFIRASITLIRSLILLCISSDISRLKARPARANSSIKVSNCSRTSFHALHEPWDWESAFGAIVRKAVPARDRTRGSLDGPYCPIARIEWYRLCFDSQRLQSYQ